MPQELPGLYYDPEKNRYFPIKSRIPGSASHSKKTLQILKPEENHKQSTQRRNETKTAILLQLRELDGNVIGSTRSKFNFQHEYQSKKASQPTIWKYKSTGRIAYGALEQLHIDMQTHEGIEKKKFLLIGKGESVSLFGVEQQVGDHFDCGVEYVPDPIWPSICENQANCVKAPGLIWIQGAEIPVGSTISSIKTTGKCSHATDAGSSIQHALIATLGSEISGGSVYVMKPSESVDLTWLPYIYRRVSKVASLNRTIWTAEYHPDRSQAVIGTDRGAALLNLETGAVSWLCRAKSDVFSQQYNQSGNAILCGFRNGAIVTIDARQKQQTLHDVLSKHRIPINSNSDHERSIKNAQKRTKGWFEFKGSIHPSSTIFMPSSISSLISLQTDDQYFLASSMDGSIKLYDHRLIQRGAVQSYEGHVNSHTRIQLGMDPSERFMTSGGEDGKVRIWCIKTGKLLFETKLSGSALATVCWPGTGMELMGVRLQHRHEEDLYEQNYYSGAWMGSADDLFYIHAS